MFAILVTVVGLFGAIAIFPAASSMARRGRIYDSAATAGRSAAHDVDARGMRRPDRWIVYSSATWDIQATPQIGYRAINQVNYPLGTAFCIDPRGVAGAAQATYDPNNPINFADEMASLFPAVARQTINGTLDPRMMRVTLTSGLKDAAGNLIYVPIPNGVSANQGQTLSSSMRLLADATFTLDDDLSYDRSTDDRSLPARQLYDLIGGTGPNAKRLADGHFSWLATLAPKVEFMPSIVGNNVIMIPRPTDEYVLSVVVLHDRLLPFEPGTGFNLSAERLVHGVFQGDGSTGGEIQLLDNVAENLKLRPNDWVLVSGVYTNGSWTPDPPPVGTTTPRFSNVPAFQWYRVTSCDKDVEPSGGNPSQQIYATLMGQDWNINSIVDPRHGVGPNATAQVTIVEGVVAVFEKTVRLEY